MVASVGQYVFALTYRSQVSTSFGYSEPSANLRKFWHAVFACLSSRSSLKIWKSPKWQGGNFESTLRQRK